MLHLLEGKRTVSRKSPLYLAERVKALTLIIHYIEDYGTQLDKICLSSQPLSSTVW
jgi:hypothetical protein